MTGGRNGGAAARAAAVLLRSPPPPPWQRLAATVALLWAAPAALGLALLGLFMAAGQAMGAAGLALWAIGMALVLSPFLSWIGWALALPAVWFLARRRRFGWLVAALTGLVAGAVAGRITGSELAAGFGLAMLLALRALLWRVPAGA